jgi:hypothetical protein
VTRPNSTANRNHPTRPRPRGSAQRASAHAHGPHTDTVADFVARTTRASDVPRLVEDRAVIDDIARLLA